MKERNYGIDLLKIVSMFMVVVLHVLRHGGILENVPILSINDTVAWVMEILCLCAVNLFALTTGYLCIDKKFNFKNVINLWIWVLFYNVLFTLLIRGFDLIPLVSSFSLCQTMHIGIFQLILVLFYLYLLLINT